MKRCILFALLSLLFAAAATAADAPRVVLETSLGNIVVQLNPEKAPISTENFLKYVKDGYFAGTVFHRVIPGFMIQGGGMTADLKEKPGARGPIKNEADNGLKNKRGTLAMARTPDPNSATSQFFINLTENTFLDHGTRDFGYAVFGEVIEGMDVVDKIAKVETGSRGGHGDVPVTAVEIKKAAVR